MQDRDATPVATLEKISRRARELGIRFPYLGNVPGHPLENTTCPKCGALLIERTGYQTRIRGLKGDRCGECGETIEIRLATGT
jgi:pyruvate formate lyase activating enzyme